MIEKALGDEKRPAPASEIGIIRITPKYSSVDATIETVRTRIGSHAQGTRERPKIQPIITIIKIENKDLLKWN